MRLRLGLAAAVCLAACAHAPSRQPSAEAATAEGWAPIDKADLPGTGRRALAEALRAAVEMAAGVRVSGSTRVAGAVAVDDAITARSRGVVRSYRILGESEEGGFHKTRVRALVEVGARPAEDGRPAPPAGDPKVAVRMTGPHAEIAAAGVRRGLIERGFSVVDGPDADVMIRGDVSVTPLGAVGPWSSSRARVNLEARQEKTGRVLWSSTREASGIGPAFAAADSKACETTGRLIGEELAREVAERLSD